MTSFSKSVAASSGSACTSALVEPSYVLKALGMSDERGSNSLRLGLGRFTTGEEIEYAAKEVAKSVQKLRSELSVL